MKEASLKRPCTHDSKSVTFWERHGYGDSRKISGCQQLGRGRNAEGEHGGFLGKSLHDIITVDKCHDTLVRTHGMCATKSHLSSQCGLWGVMSQSRFVGWNKCPSWSWRTLCGVWGVIYRTSFQFFCKPKTISNITVLTYNKDFLTILLSRVPTMLLLKQVRNKGHRTRETS